MTVFREIEEWLSKFKSQLITYRRGFFVFPYVINSPTEMIERFRKMRFIRFDTKKQRFSSKTPFVNSVTWYREIENDLFLLYSEVKFRTNVHFRQVVDKAAPLEHYCLSLRTDSYSKGINSLAGDISYPDNTWLLFKPGKALDHHHFKGTTGKYYTLYFTKTWLEENIFRRDREAEEQLQVFLASESDHLICPGLQHQDIYNTNNLYQLFLSEIISEEERGRLFKKEVLGFVRFFTAKMRAERINEKHFLVGGLERMKILFCEHILKAHLYRKFPGISYLASETGLSETKLKECFKIMHDTTLFRYFQSIQMEEARRLILGTDLNIGEVAQKLAYENASKFSAAFGEYHSCLPSEIKKLISKGPEVVFPS